MVMRFDDVALAELLIYDTVLGERRLIPGEPPTTPRKYIVPDLDASARLHSCLGADKIAPWLIETLCETISSASQDRDVLIPISGGLDSRILLACATHVLNRERIHCVTFGASQSNLEFRIARQVCKQLRIRDHQFFQLGIDEYRSSIPLLANLTCGEISAYHCHLLSYLESRKGSLPPVLVSGLLADAVAGYGQDINQESSSSYEDTSPFFLLEERGSQFALGATQLEAVKTDLRLLWEEFRGLTYPRSFAEYFYITQRNGNALLRLADIYDSFFDCVSIPFGSPVVAGALASIPSELRQGKRVLRLVLSEEFPSLSGIPVYSSIEDTRVFSERTKQLLRKSLTLLEFSGDFIFRDRTPLWNPWQNEMHGRLLRTSLRMRLVQSCDMLAEKGYLSSTTATRLQADHYRSWWHAAQFHCLSMAHLLSE